MQNKLISNEYFEKNINKIENIKDKELLNSILVLVSFHSGNTLLSGKNISKFDSVSIYSASVFSQSLIKDIVDSYNLLEKSILNVSKSIYKDLLLQNPTINGEEFYVCENTLVQKDLLEDFKKVFDENVEEDGTINNDLASPRELNNRKLDFSDNNNVFNYFNSFNENKKNLLITFEKDGEKYEFLNKTGLVFKENSVIKKISGKYKNRVQKSDISFENIKEFSITEAMREKYDLSS